MYLLLTTGFSWLVMGHLIYYMSCYNGAFKTHKEFFEGWVVCILGWPLIFIIAFGVYLAKIKK